MGDKEQSTAAPPSNDADMKDAEQEQKRGTTDYSKLEQQIAAQKASAKQVSFESICHVMCAVRP